MKYGVRSIPTILFLKNGEVVGGNPARVIAMRKNSELDKNIKNEKYFHRVYWNKKRIRKVSLRK